MSVRVELQQLVDIALATPEIGNVNFNILRGFLHEILKHLGIRKKVVYISDEGDFKTAYDFIKDGILLARSTTPSELDLIDEDENDAREANKRSISPVRRKSYECQISGKNSLQKRSRSASPRLSERSATISSEPVHEGTKETSDVGDRKEKETPQEGSVKSTPADIVVHESSPKPPNTGIRSHNKSPLRSPKASRALLEPGRSSIETRRSVEVLLGRGEAIKNLTHKVSELQARIDALENAETKEEVSIIPSAASIIRKESKTPAHDMMQIISVSKRLEETENSIEGLTELVDVLSAELTEVKEAMPSKKEIPDMRNNLKDLKSSINEVKKQTDDSQNSHASQLSALEKTVDEMKKALNQQLKDVSNRPAATVDMAEVEKFVGKKIDQEMDHITKSLARQQTHDSPAIVVSSELPSEVTDLLEKFDVMREKQTSLEEEVKAIRELAEAMETKDDDEETDSKSGSVNEQSTESQAVHIPHEIVHDMKLLKKKLDSCSKDSASTHSSLRRLDVENKKLVASIDDNKALIDQLKNNIALLQREAAEAATSTPVRQDDTLPPTPSRSKAHTIDDKDLSLIRTMIFDLQEEKDKLKQANRSIWDEIYQQKKVIDDIDDQVTTLHDVKADKSQLSSEVEVKADKADMLLKVGRDDFDHYIGLVDQSLRDLLQRLEGHETALKQAIESISSNVRTKLDKDEVEPLKHYLEERIKALKPKPVEAAPPEEFAAGFRKVLIKNFHCISCDKPVEFARDGMFPPLPSAQPMPGKKSNRPYTTFELEQIRQHMLRGGMALEQERFEVIDKQRQKIQKELLMLSGVPNIQGLAEVIDRPCGGTHTLSFPHSRQVVRGLHMNKEDVTLETICKMKNYTSVNIMGQDGHIYKGLVDDLSTLPHLPHKPQTPRKPSSQQEGAGQANHRSSTPASAQYGHVEPANHSDSL
ncbi:glutamine-rich protein 2 [Nematostella vectensis]|uniref:glutamine-rich protein 2 n=1 Tax=Nematostella vectensis TaxID=45351 RepID=UPI002076FF34|nr:glutamine-rich protein 2 [Nematostella vectensis]